MQPVMERLRGRVVRGAFGTGTKSEHTAVMLRTADREFVLRRSGGNAFSDPEVERLVGKQIECEGDIVGTTMIMTSWHEIG